jgi:hypothetical protein
MSLAAPFGGGSPVNGGGGCGNGGRDGGVGVSEDSIAPSPEAAGAALESAQHSSHAAGAEGGGSFSSQHLACVLSAAMPTKKEMKELVRDLKEKSKEAFRGLTQASTAENIAECRPDGVIHAEGFLSWLVVEKKLLTMKHLRQAMDNLEPAIKWLTRDKQEVLIKKIVEEMRAREGSALKRGADGAEGARPEKKTKTAGEAGGEETAGDELAERATADEYVEHALRNYERFHGLPAGTATIDQLQASSAGIDGSAAAAGGAAAGGAGNEHAERDHGDFGRALTVETAVQQLVWAHANPPEGARAVAMEFVVANYHAIQVVVACLYLAVGSPFILALRRGVPR